MNLLFRGRAPRQPVALLASQPAAGADDPSAACARVAALRLPAATIEAGIVAPGTFEGPPALFSQVDIGPLYKSLPAFCRVSAIATPTPDSRTAIEVWLPTAGWNRRLIGIGNGGFAGGIDYLNVATALSSLLVGLDEPRLCQPAGAIRFCIRLHQHGDKCLGFHMVGVVLDYDKRGVHYAVSASISSYSACEPKNRIITTPVR